MKIFKLLIVVFTAFLFYTCSEETSHEISGFWQLQQITYPDSTTEPVDTVFYAFQKQTAFSFTVLVNPDSATISYGYLYFPEDDHVRIKMDMDHGISENEFLSFSGWASTDETFLVDIHGNKMTLIDSRQRVFQFKKF